MTGDALTGVLREDPGFDDRMLCACGQSASSDEAVSSGRTDGRA
ncbi:hypothetical protein OHB49_44105 (plasmid) [Streptomyces sp. NBC_01717]|nr:hypothetical protein [Streptomyces sp. NBC_01717]